MGTYLVLKDRYAEEIKNDDRFSAFDAVDDVCRASHQVNLSQNYLVLIHCIGVTCGYTWL
jgi:hypothetical protein